MSKEILLISVQGSTEEPLNGITTIIDRNGSGNMHLPVQGIYIFHSFLEIMLMLHYTVYGF
jgi:hypothetical protein